jgi:pyruvate kinase
MCEKDKEDIRWGIENDVDFIAASFTRRASDIRDIRNYVNSLMPKYHSPNHPAPLV